MANRTKALELYQDQLTDNADPSGIAGNFGKLGTFIIDRANMLSSGQSVCDRRNAQGSINPVSGELWLSYWTGYLGTVGSQSLSTQVKLWVTGTVAAGLTLARVGLYTISSVDQSGTLVASTASNTAIWTPINSPVTVSWQSSYALALGQRYALAVLFVGTTPPSLVGAQGASLSSLNSLSPRMHGKLTGQTDLPSTFTEASLSSVAAGPFGVILP
jgi:hypothetical protein